MTIASDDASAAAEIRKLEREVLQLRVRHDPEAEKRLLSKDYVLTVGGFRIAGEAQWQAMGWKPENTYRSAEPSDIDVRIYDGDAAVSTSRVKVAHHAPGVQENLLVTRVWIKTGEQWQLVSTHASQAMAT